MLVTCFCNNTINEIKVCSTHNQSLKVFQCCNNLSEPFHRNTQRDGSGWGRRGQGRSVLYEVLTHSRCITQTRWVSEQPQIGEVERSNREKNDLLCKVSATKCILTTTKKKNLYQLECWLYLEYYHHFTLPSAFNGWELKPLHWSTLSSNPPDFIDETVILPQNTSSWSAAASSVTAIMWHCLFSL